MLVTFEEFKDRDEVLRKAGLLKGGNIHVTEDMSRRVRESRQELRRFMRDVRRANPASVCNLQYDSLYVDKKCFKYNPVEGRVVEHSAGAVSTQTGPSPTLCLSVCLGLPGSERRRTSLSTGQDLALLLGLQAGPGRHCQEVAWPLQVNTPASPLSQLLSAGLNLVLLGASVRTTMSWSLKWMKK